MIAPLTISTNALELRGRCVAKHGATKGHRGRGREQRIEGGGLWLVVARKRMMTRARRMREDGSRVGRKRMRVRGKGMREGHYLGRLENFPRQINH